jgi:hypothetical protein
MTPQTGDRRPPKPIKRPWMIASLVLGSAIALWAYAGYLIRCPFIHKR